MHVLVAPTVKTPSAWRSHRPRAGRSRTVNQSIKAHAHKSGWHGGQVGLCDASKHFGFLLHCVDSMLHTPLPGKGKERRAYLVVVVVGIPGGSGQAELTVACASKF